MSKVSNKLKAPLFSNPESDDLMHKTRMVQQLSQPGVFRYKFFNLSRWWNSYDSNFMLYSQQYICLIFCCFGYF